jgi:hypothetical protein
MNKDEWDADERNKQNNLAKYLDSLTRQQREMIKGIISKDIPLYLSLDEEDFRKRLQDSLTLNELSKLSREEIGFRDKVIEDTMAVWRRQKEEMKEIKKEGKQREEYYDEKAAEDWMPKHHRRTPDEDSKTRIVDYWSKTHSVDMPEAPRLQMYCPRCRKMVDQTKSFQMKNGHYTDEPCVCCSKCGLVYDCDHYKRLMKEESSRSQKQEQSQHKLENKVLQNKGWKI